MKKAVFDISSNPNYNLGNNQVSFRFSIPGGKIRIYKIVGSTVFVDSTNSVQYYINNVWQVSLQYNSLSFDIGAIRPTALSLVSGGAVSQVATGIISFSNDVPFIDDKAELLNCDEILVSSSLTIPEINLPLPASYQSFCKVNFFYELE